VSRGRCDGRAVLFALNTDYSLRENLALGLSFRRIIITTTGRQHQSAPDFSASVDQHIDSDQRYFGSTVGYRF
jgi:long-subunit fatty acid transport protein